MERGNVGQRVYCNGVECDFVSRREGNGSGIWGRVSAVLDFWGKFGDELDWILVGDEEARGVNVGRARA